VSLVTEICCMCTYISLELQGYIYICGGKDEVQPYIIINPFSNY